MFYPVWTSALAGVSGKRQESKALPPGYNPGSHCTGNWMDSGRMWEKRLVLYISHYSANNIFKKLNYLLEFIAYL
jgi:hypothetical protein